MADLSPPLAVDLDERVSQAKVFVELDSLVEAERLITSVLEDHPDHITALNLLAKIKHIKGEVSQAIGCWAQIHARSPNNENAQLFLMSILNLAQNPERNAGDYIVLGQFQLVKKPSAHLDLEKAFGHFLAREPEKARAVCARLALDNKAKDRDVFRLAVLAEAWIAQHSEQLQDARQLLEDLGKASGFETDFDRVMALSRIYEQIGTDEALGAALHILRYLKRRQEKITLYPALVQVCRRLNMEEDAEGYEQTYLKLFMRRMHLPTLEEVIDVASHRYIPLKDLVNVRRSDNVVPVDLDPLERAIADYLGSESFAVQPFLELGDSGILGLKYAAEAHAMLGQPQAAEGLLRQIMTQVPGDIDAAGSWLDLQADKHLTAGSGPPTDVMISAGAAEVLKNRTMVEPLDFLHWRRMGLLSMLRGDLVEADRCLERCNALMQVNKRRDLPIGRVLTAAVYNFIGKKKGLIHEMWADRHPVPKGTGGAFPERQVLGNVHPDLKDAIRNVFVATKEYARAKFPTLTRDINDFEYVLKITKEDEPSGGLSAGLPTALAFLSVFLQRPVPSSIASSGVVITDAHDQIALRHVQDTEIKIKGAFNRNLETLILPFDNARELQNPFHVPRDIVARTVKFARTLDEAVTLVFGREVWTS